MVRMSGWGEMVCMSVGGERGKNGNQTIQCSEHSSSCEEGKGVGRYSFLNLYKERCKRGKNYSQLYIRRLISVVESMDNGKPIRESRDLDIPLVARHFYHHAGTSNSLERDEQRVLWRA